MSSPCCPKCHTIIMTGGRAPSRCRKCGEKLGVCRHCLHFDPRVLACEHPQILPIERILDPDEFRDCPYFIYLPTRKLKARKLFLRLSLGVWKTLAVALVCFGLLYFGLGKYRGAGNEQAVLEAKMEEPGTVMSDETFDIVARVENKGKQEAEHVTCRLGKETLEIVELMEVDPPPRDWKESQGGYIVDVGSLPPGEVQLMRLTFRPLKLGRFPFKIVVFASNGDAPQTLKTYLTIEK